MTASVRLRLLAFAVIGVLAVTVSAVRYARLADPLAAPTYTVRIELSESGGLFTGSGVTLRGVQVGRVRDVRLVPGGVEAVAEIEKEVVVPADLTASVHNGSAVGEQYVDLVPRSSRGAVLGEGDVIPRSDTTTPVPEEEVLANLDALVGSVDTDDLRFVVDELGTGMVDAGDDLQRIIDGSDELTRQAQESLTATTRLIADGSTVLSTQVRSAADLRSTSRNLRQVSETIRSRDQELRTVLRDAPPLMGGLDQLATELDGSLAALWSPSVRLGLIALDHLAGIEQTLVALPIALGPAMAGVRDGRAMFSLALTPMPTSCQRGYLPPREWRSTQDTRTAPLKEGLRCAETGKLYRGSNHAP